MAKRKKSKSSGMKPAIMFVAVGVLGVAGFAYYVKSTPAAATIPTDQRRAEVTAPQSDASPAQNRHREVDITVPASDYLVPKIVENEVKLVGAAPAVPEGIDTHVFLVTETFKSLGIDEGRATGINIKDGIAHIDVNSGFVGHGFGSTEEGQVIKALQLALGQFNDVDRFQLYFEGQLLDSLGNADLTDPIAVVRASEEPGPTHTED